MCKQTSEWQMEIERSLQLKDTHSAVDRVESDLLSSNHDFIQVPKLQDKLDDVAAVLTSTPSSKNPY